MKWGANINFCDLVKCYVGSVVIQLPIEYYRHAQMGHKNGWGSVDDEFGDVFLNLKQGPNERYVNLRQILWSI